MSDAKSHDFIWRMISEIGTCMMVTQNGNTPRARPMRGIARPEQNTVWFFTDVKAHAADEIVRHPRGCLAYADPTNQSFVSVSGQLSVVQDRKMIAELWTEGADAYFPAGKEDPNVQLLKFVAEAAEYWDSPSNPIVLAIQFLQAKITGTRPQLGVHDSVRLP